MPPPFVRPFHFWCQKVLPLVFDDSLSYYEVLAKMRDYLNNAIKEINEIGSEFEGVKTQLTQLRTYVDEYFAGLDVNQAISDKLDNMVESGEMDAVITPIFAAYANPLFAASVADMVATNFAYANYENNKIYTFNQSTGLYQTTGKEFGGVVSSVDKMEDNDKYYALDSDGMLYSYDFPQSAFVATGLTYGGYRYGVNAMRPLSNVYVLTSDNHVYSWNGVEYYDTGVVYGLSNTAFIWRKILDANDNTLNLAEDGYYLLNTQNPPTGLPSNYSPVSPLLQSFTTNGEKRVLIADNGCLWFYCEEWINLSVHGYDETTDCNTAPKNSFTVTLNAENTPNDTDGELITLETVQLFSTGSALYVRRIDSEWIELCAKADLTELASLVSTFHQEYEQLKIQQRQFNNTLRQDVSDIGRRVDFYINRFTELDEYAILAESNLAITTESALKISANVSVLKTDKTLTVKNSPADSEKVGIAIKSVVDAISYTNELIDVSNNEFNQRMDEISATTQLYDKLLTTVECVISCGDGLVIATESGNDIAVFVRMINTDTTLTLSNVPADSKATGNALMNMRLSSLAYSSETDEKVRQLQSQLSTIIVSVPTANIENLNTESGLCIMQETLSVKVDTTLSKSGIPADAGKVGEVIGELNETVYAIKGLALLSQNDKRIVCENTMPISATHRAVNTDNSLALANVPADAKATGNAISKITEKAENYSQVRGIEGYTIPIIRLYGELPTTKTNVNMTAHMFDRFTIPVKVKVQGSSSLSNPEKNYTLKFDSNVSFMGFNTDKWNAKCNFIDPTQMRNIICARLWKKCVDFIYPFISGDICDNSRITITQENGNAISAEKANITIQKSPYDGASEGDTVILYVNDEFHGIYTLQLPKGKYMWGMSGNSMQFACSINYWNWTPLSASDIVPDGAVEIEENTDDMTANVIAQKLNAIIECINGDNFANEIGNYVDINLWICYICFSLFVYHFDGIVRNQILYSFNGGNTINPSVWDMDCTFGNSWTAIRTTDPDGNYSTWNNNKLFHAFFKNMPEQVKSMWNSLRANVLNMATVWNLVNNFSIHTNERLYQMDFKKWPMKGKSYLYSPMVPIQWARDNMEKADSFIQNI